MRGHLAARCRQPQCSRCNKWWHTEDECARSCSTCGSLDHRVCGGALCKSYKCRECGLYGHVYAECPNIRCNLCTAAAAPAAAAPAAAAGAGEEAADATQGIKPGDLAPQHARALQEEFGDMLPSRWQQLPSWRQLEARLSFPDGNYVQRRLQFREKRRQLQLMTLQQQLQRQGSSVSSSSQQPPASPLSAKAAGGNSSSGGGAPSTLSNGGSDSSLCPPDSPGLGQHGVKPKDLLPEHAKALQEEFPNALPPGWQAMASWRMVEERLRVVAVEGAVFSKRRQMWRDRRKHYQALTAAALAAAARSAAAADADEASAARSSSLGVPCAGSSSGFSCDTSFVCSTPAATQAEPHAMMLGQLGDAGNSTPLPASSMPAPGGGGAMGLAALTAGRGGQIPAALSLPLPLAPAPCGTPLPAPRSAAQAAAAAAAVSASWPMQQGGYPGGLMPGEMGKQLPSMAYSPLPNLPSSAGMMPSPLGYPGPPPSSPMEMHSAAAAAAAMGRGMQPAGVGMPGPAMYHQHQQHLVAQRQSQLQQMLLQGRYSRSMEQPPPLASPQHHQQHMLLQMQMQQQAHAQAQAQAQAHAQQQMRMQRRMDQAYLVQQQQQAAVQRQQQQQYVQKLAPQKSGGLLVQEEAGDNGELDDKLGVLGVLGLQ
ncbi:hypothetical protein OEZ85_010310 [Tetradesmus obliquus]|uniref:CCHC-type domain-containing protein n=1 Tax=Tetradesmus obliquus TaxID=3088 RepID=A0ABY8TP18_TETOB|nr:hypothetical protein OEZ85_010310 [Tetradesmus obliquus]